MPGAPYYRLGVPTVKCPHCNKNAPLRLPKEITIRWKTSGKTQRVASERATCLIANGNATLESL